MSPRTSVGSRPRVDLHGQYTRTAVTPSEAFPDRTESWVPLIEIGVCRLGGGGLWTRALLDTGSTLSLFPVFLAEALGLDWRTAPRSNITGISGTVPAHVVPIRMILRSAAYDWTTKVAFAPDLKVSVPILGHLGFFEHFEVRFRTAQSQFRVFLK